MTPITIKTYNQDQYTVLEFAWFDQKLRRPASVRAGMDRERTLELIAELQNLTRDNS